MFGKNRARLLKTTSIAIGVVVIVSMILAYFAPTV